MISLAKTKHKEASKFFYDTVKDEVLARLNNHQLFFDGFLTDSSKTSLYLYLKNNLTELLIGDIENNFDRIQRELKSLFVLEYKNIKKIPTPFKIAIDNVFFYQEHAKWKAYDVIKKIGIGCCPYCNRNYITTVGDDESKFIRADFDHFLGKARYPYFRFSFYNLIPSCIICSRKAKGRQSTNLANFIYPYKEGFNDDAKFTYIPKSYDELKKGKGSIISINPKDPKSDKGKRIGENIRLFRLKDQYSIHFRELHFILQKKNAHPEGYILTLRKAFPKLFSSDSEAYEFIFGKSINEEDFIHQPLAKFTKDICEEIGIIK